MLRRRMYELIATMMIGDSMLFLMSPRAHIQLWETVLPWRWWHSLCQWYTTYPLAGRITGIVEFGLGAWLLHYTYQGISDKRPRRWLFRRQPAALTTFE